MCIYKELRCFFLFQKRPRPCSKDVCFTNEIGQNDSYRVDTAILMNVTDKHVKRQTKCYGYRKMGKWYLVC